MTVKCPTMCRLILWSLKAQQIRNLRMGRMSKNLRTVTIRQRHSRVTARKVTSRSRESREQVSRLMLTSQQRQGQGYLAVRRLITTATTYILSRYTMAPLRSRRKPPKMIMKRFRDRSSRLSTVRRCRDRRLVMSLKARVIGESLT